MLLIPFSNVARTLRIKKYHLFRFRKETEGIVGLKEFSCTDLWEYVLLIGNNSDVGCIYNATGTIINFITTAIPLGEVPSAKEVNLREYIEMHVC